MDHIVRVALQPELAFEPRNLVALCKSCHSRKTAREVGFTPSPSEVRPREARVTQG